MLHWFMHSKQLSLMVFSLQIRHLGDLEIQRYTQDEIKDSFDNMSLTLEGSIGELEVVYAGAYTDRDTNQMVDYTDYLFVGQYLPYYICDYGM